MSSNNILCLFNSEAILMLDQHPSGEILIETDATLYGSERFDTPFRLGKSENTDDERLYRFFQELLEHQYYQGYPDFCVPQHNPFKPHIIQIQDAGHGKKADLCIYSSPKGITGIQAKNTSYDDKNCPVVWINKPIFS